MKRVRGWVVGGVLSLALYMAATAACTADDIATRSPVAIMGIDSVGTSAAFRVEGARIIEVVKPHKVIAKVGKPIAWMIYNLGKEPFKVSLVKFRKEKTPCEESKDCIPHAEIFNGVVQSKVVNPGDRPDTLVAIPKDPGSDISKYVERFWYEIRVEVDTPSGRVVHDFEPELVIEKP